MEDDQGPEHIGLIARLKRLMRSREIQKEEAAALRKVARAAKRSIKDPSQVDDSTIRMIASVLEFGDKVVREIMVPRVDMVSVDRTAGVDELKRIMAAEGHSRIPIYDGSADNIIGIVHVRDLIRRETLKKNGSFTIDEIKMEPYFVPETKKAKELLATFRTDKNLMAIAVDEYGGTAGLVTIEDLLEEIVGEIRGEFEPELEEQVKIVDAKTLIADGKADLDLLREYVSIYVDNHDFDTLGGFILDQLGSVPSGEENFEFNGLRFTVIEADERRVLKVKIERLQGQSEARDKE
ncbi:HlyC/CorC family transporter [bacterium]|nr:HlyC/CorC family transporter [bacterium]